VRRGMVRVRFGNRGRESEGECTGKLTLVTW
jgi:hypothetical protein